MGFFFNTYLTLDMTTGREPFMVSPATPPSTQEPVFAPRSANAP